MWAWHNSCCGFYQLGPAFGLFGQAPGPQSVTSAGWEDDIGRKLLLVVLSAGSMKIIGLSSGEKKWRTVGFSSIAMAWSLRYLSFFHHFVRFHS